MNEPYACLTEYELRYLPTHLGAAGYWDDLEGVLTDLPFLGAKTEAGMVDGLLRDYEEARVAFASRWDEGQSIAEFARFLSHEAHFLRSAPEAFYQQGINSDDGPVRRAALRSAGTASPRPWLRKSAGTNRSYHSGSVISMAFWGQDRYLAVSTTEREVWIWDLHRATLWRRCDTPPSAAKSLAVSPDGELLAAGFGAADPTPLVAGAVVWSREGRTHRVYELGDWVYHVRWAADDRLILAAGLPNGSEAAGTLWQARLSGDVCEEIGRHLAARPLVLTWDPVPGRADQMMMLSMDGVVCHLTPDFAPITDKQVNDLFYEIHLADGKTDSETTHARMVEYDERVKALRPVVADVCSPCTGTFGFHQAAQVVGPNTICILGEPPVPPEMLMFHKSVPDGIYLYDFDQRTGGGIQFNRDALDAGYRAICLVAEPGGTRRVAVGTEHGEVVLISLRPDGIPVESLHRGDYPVTAVCFSESGTAIAVGGGGGEIAVYDRAGRGLVFENRRAAAPLAARVGDDSVLILHRNRLVLTPLVTVGPGADMPLPEGWGGLDFDRHGDLAVVLSGRLIAGTESVEYSIHFVNVATRQVVLTCDVPGEIPQPQGSFASGKPDYLRRVRLCIGGGRAALLVGSPRGLVEYPLLAPSGGLPLVIPYDRDARERTITVMRGHDTPEISCESVAVSPGGAVVYCGYADNQDHPRVSGELRQWTGPVMTPSAEQRFGGKVQVLAATGEGVVVVGTDEGEASSWSFGAGWERLTDTRHAVAVVAVACEEDRGLACSASRDGEVRVWGFRTGAPLLRTFVDVEPVFVGFFAGGGCVCMVDRGGEVHAWEIEGGELGAAGPGRSRGADASEIARKCLDGLAHLGRVEDIAARGDRAAAAALLESLPDVPDRLAVQAYWRAKLTAGSIGAAPE